MAKGRKTGGRIAGVSKNKTTSDIKELAKQYGPDAIARLAELSGLSRDPETGLRIPSTEAGPTQVAAVKELLDRGYGKARQPIDHDVEGALEDFLSRLPP